MFIHQNIKYLRELKSLTQTEFGALFHLSRGQIQSYETKIKPSFAVMSQISHYFSINVEDLINIDFSKQKNADAMIKINGDNNYVNNEIKLKSEPINKDSDKDVNDLLKELDILKKEINHLKELIAMKDKLIQLLEKHGG